MTVKVGDKIRVTNPILNRNRYGIGDEFTVAKVWHNGYGIDTDDGTELYTREFEVIPCNPHAELNALPMGNEVGTEEMVKRAEMASKLGFTLGEVVTPEIKQRDISELNGKTLRIYSSAVESCDIKTEVTVGIDEATGVMYVLGMKTEVSE